MVILDDGVKVEKIERVSIAKSSLLLHWWTCTSDIQSSFTNDLSLLNVSMNHNINAIMINSGKIDGCYLRNDCSIKPKFMWNSKRRLDTRQWWNNKTTMCCLFVLFSACFLMAPQCTVKSVVSL